MGQIIGQCNQVHFVEIEHLSLVVDKPELLDMSTLTKSQKLAFVFFNEARKKGISWGQVRQVVKEVLFWDAEGSKPSVMEIRLRKSAGLDERKEFKRMWNSNP